MKKIDLNIKIDDLQIDPADKGKRGWEIAKKFIDNSFILYQQQPQMEGMRSQSVGIKVSEQRKIYKILDATEAMKGGILDLEDDWFNFLRKVFNGVRWVGATKVIVRVADRIDEADKKEEAKTNKDKEGKN